VLLALKVNAEEVSKKISVDPENSDIEKHTQI
jgi:hypothetical protein